MQVRDHICRSFSLNEFHRQTDMTVQLVIRMLSLSIRRKLGALHSLLRSRSADPKVVGLNTGCVHEQETYRWGHMMWHTTIRLYIYASSCDVVALAEERLILVCVARNAVKRRGMNIRSTISTSHMSRTITHLQSHMHDLHQWTWICFCQVSRYYRYIVRYSWMTYSLVKWYCTDRELTQRFYGCGGCTLGIC